MVVLGLMLGMMVQVGEEIWEGLVGVRRRGLSGVSGSFGELFRGKEG